MRNFLTVAQAKTRENILRAVMCAENAHQIVFQRKEKDRCARIALPARTAAQLVIDAARFMPLGADHEQTARRADFLARLVDFTLQRSDGGFVRRAVERKFREARFEI